MRALTPPDPSPKRPKSCRLRSVYFTRHGVVAVAPKTGRNRSWSEVFDESFSAVWNPKILEIQGHLIIYISFLKYGKGQLVSQGLSKGQNLKQWYLRMTLKLLSNMLLQHLITLQNNPNPSLYILYYFNLFYILVLVWTYCPVNYLRVLEILLLVELHWKLGNISIHKVHFDSLSIMGKVVVVRAYNQ